MNSMIFDRNVKGAFINETFRIDDALWKKATSFSREIDEKHGDYIGKQRNQQNADARITQNAYGKCGEHLFVAWMRSKGVDILSDVDWAIYDSSEKSFASDVVVRDIESFKISCKASLYKRSGRTTLLDGTPIHYDLPYQHSWTIQLSNTESVGGLDNFSHDVYCLSSVEGERIMSLYAWVWAKHISGMMIAPFKDELFGVKGCIMERTCILENGPMGVKELIEDKRYVNQ